MPANKSQNWRAVKAKLIIRYGGVSAAANALGCSAEGIRLSAKGQCPGIAKRLESVIGKTK